MRVLARDPARLPFPLTAVEVVTGDLNDPPALARLVAGADAVVHLVGIIAETRTATFAGVHVEGPRRVADAARTAGVRRIVHMSAIGARADPAATPYHRTKAAGEAVIRATPVPHVILRPTLIVGPESVPLTMLARLHRVLPAVPVFGDGHFPLQPIWIGDVAAAFTRAAEGAVPQGTFEIGGPDRVTYAEFVRAIGRSIGRPRPLLHVPLPLARLGARLGDALPGDLAPLTTDQLQMLIEGSTAADNAVTRVLGRDPVPLADALRRVADAWQQPRRPRPVRAE